MYFFYIIQHTFAEKIKVELSLNDKMNKLKHKELKKESSDFAMNTKRKLMYRVRVYKTREHHKRHFRGFTCYTLFNSAMWY